jgi:uncharacterized protein (TIRG00374 family)
MKKYNKYLIPSILFSALFYIALSFYGDWDKIVKLFESFPLLLIPLLLGLSLLNYFTRFLKWHYYLKVIKAKVNFGESFLVFNSALSLSFSPGKIGDLIKSVFLKESHKIEISKTASIVLVERITDFTSLLLISIIGAFVFNYGHGAVLAVSFFFLILITVLSVPSFGKKIILYLGKIKFLHKILEPFEIAYNTSNQLLFPSRLLLMTLLSLISWFFECLGFYIILINFKVQISVFGASFIYAFSTIIGAVTMLPAGIGFTEGSLTFLLIQNGSTKDIAVAATLLVRFVTLWFAVLFGVANLFLYKFYKRSEK